jgi:hypothetical protein
LALGGQFREPPIKFSHGIFQQRALSLS